jgi:hypothetical protein
MYRRRYWYCPPPQHENSPLVRTTEPLGAKWEEMKAPPMAAIIADNSLTNR